MNFEQMMKDRIASAMETKVAQNEQAKMALLDNQDFINTQVEITMLNSEINKLNQIITQLNLIKPFIAKDGRRFNVNVFPVSTFGPGFGQLIGIIQGSKSAFTDEMALQYEAITGVSHLELTMCSDALGTADYYKAGSEEVQHGQEGDMKKFIPLIRSIEAKLGLSMIVPESDDDIINTIERWQISSNKRAEIKLEESRLSENLDTDSFVLED